MTAGPAWIDWFWWIGGWAVALAGLSLLLWSLLGDRVRGRRRRCPKCWYDLSGTPGQRCSECGYEAKRERKLFKTRRRWRWAAAAGIMMIASYGACVTPRVQKDGCRGFVPTTALIALMPWDVGADLEPVMCSIGWRVTPKDLLNARLISGDSWRWQRRWLARRAANVLLGTCRDRPLNLDRALKRQYRMEQLVKQLGPDAGSFHDVLYKALTDSDPTIRVRALREFESVPTKSLRDVKAILARQDDEIDYVRIAALEALRNCTSDPLVLGQALSKARSDPSPDVQSAANAEY